MSGLVLSVAVFLVSWLLFNQNDATKAFEIAVISLAGWLVVFAIGLLVRTPWLVHRHAQEERPAPPELHWKFGAMGIGILVLIVVGIAALGFGIYARGRGAGNTGLPLSGTDAATAWTYTPLKEVHRRTYHDERVVLDGTLFIECTFGPRLTLVYNGTAPFEMLNSVRTADFGPTLSLETSNMIIKKFFQMGVVMELFKFPQNMKFGDNPPPENK